jgi:uncharacterized protein Smg (DUF494 family)
MYYWNLVYYHTETKFSISPNKIKSLKIKAIFRRTQEYNTLFTEENQRNKKTISKGKIKNKTKKKRSKKYKTK